MLDFTQEFNDLVRIDLVRASQNNRNWSKFEKTKQ